MSSDLELYVAAEVSRRLSTRIRDETLKHEIIETLVIGAEGMFQWVKCQLDYLIRLPNDSERRKALKQLPPDLPATHIRIFERICRDYPPQTQELIKRIFKWVTFGLSDVDTRAWEAGFQWHATFTMRALAIAITIDVTDGQLNESEIPSIDDICEWYGSLIRVEGQEVVLSHFTIAEFLTSRKEVIQSDDAQKFLVNELEFQPYLASASLIYISHHKLPKAHNFDHGEAINEFTSRFPLYGTAAVLILHYLSRTELDFEAIAWSQQFFTSKHNFYIILWFQFDLALTNLVEYNTCRRLLSEGADANERTSVGVLPIDLAFAYGMSFHLTSQATITIASPSDLKLEIIKLLIQAGAHINHTVETIELLELDIDFKKVDIPTIALVLCKPTLCELLLENGATVNEGNLLRFMDEFGSWMCRSINWQNSGLNYADFGRALGLILNYVQDFEMRKDLKNYSVFLDSRLSSTTQSNRKSEYSTGAELFAAIDSQIECVLQEILEETDDLVFVDGCGQRSK
ncbi:MAG: hypothetical protein Q9160_005602 [Pyrenula sp. 1 TL-2023]